MIHTRMESRKGKVEETDLTRRRSTTIFTEWNEPSGDSLVKDSLLEGRK